MSHFTSRNAENNPTSITLIVNSQRIPLALPQLLLQEVREQVREYCANAHEVIACDWQSIVASPSEVSEFFLQLISESAATWHFQVAGHPETFDDVLDATLNTRIDRQDLADVAHATAFAIATAATVCPGAASEAATRIREWLTRNGIHSDSVKSIAAQIRRNCPDPDANGRLNPQDAARMVLAHLQSEREARGETEIATPPVWYYLEEFYRWDGREWKLSPSFELMVVRILQDVVQATDLTNNFIKSVITNLKGLVLLERSDVRPPFRICDEARQEIRECQVLGFDNGIVDISGLQATGNGVQLAPHSPSLFKVPRFNYRVEPAATCPMWFQTLLEIMAATSPSDYRIALLQEFFGYCLLSTNHRFEAFLILLGGWVERKIGRSGCSQRDARP